MGISCPPKEMLMDSILNNTSYAFIQGLGYEIKNYAVKTGQLSPVGTNSRTFTVPTFSRAFIDVVCDSLVSGGYYCWTIRPYMLLSTDTTLNGFYTTWVVTSQSTSKPYLVSQPTKVSSSLPCRIKSISSSSIMIESGDGNSLQCTIFFYVVD